MSGLIDMLVLQLFILGHWAIVPIALVLLVCLIFGPRVRTLCFLTAKWVGVYLAVTGGLIALVVLRLGLGGEWGGGLVYFVFPTLLPILGEFLALIACYRWR